MAPLVDGFANRAPRKGPDCLHEIRYWITLLLMEERAKRERSMRSPVNWTVLGLVIERPSYGWELWTRFDRLYGDVLPVGSESNVYGALDALRDRGLIEEVTEPRASGAGRQPKLHYRATAEGLEGYAGWVIAQAREHNRRSLLFARQLGALAEQPEAALGILERYEQACLDDKGARIPTSREFPSRAVPALADRLASAYGRSVMAGTFGWIDYARREFETLAGGERGSR
jgi:DNA-binding PadR family transcriptional regulator